MKQFAAMLIGFCATLTIFAGGVLTAIFFVNAEPVPVHKVDMSAGSLWTSKAVRTRAATKDLKRLPARTTPQQAGTEPQPLQGPPPASRPQPIESGATAFVSTQDATYPSMNTAHTEWCSQRYRSYDPADDSYNAYSGVRRKCISPYSRGDEPEIVNASVESSPALITAHFDEMSGAQNSQHVQSCFERYQSYRPEDNTYQPYGGGSREQCE